MFKHKSKHSDYIVCNNCIMKLLFSKETQCQELFKISKSYYRKLKQLYTRTVLIIQKLQIVYTFYNNNFVSTGG